MILRLFESFPFEGPDGRPNQSLGRRSKNPAGRFQGAEGFHALATEIDASITSHPGYISKNITTTLTHLSETEIVRETMNDLTGIIKSRYDYSLALRSHVTRTRSEELGEMTLQEVSQRAKKFNYAWNPHYRELSEILSETTVQKTLTTVTSTLAAYGYYLTARPLVLGPEIEDPWAEFR